ncbi:MAG: ATP-binding cassette domain-containing protein [Proteobacteria bacterium]|nr:ATP-binding cassette domain-containing protein [Pseudomonadota bacterium]
MRAVHETSFTLAAGETLAIVGESGSGKTTITKAILGLQKPSGGTISFAGMDLARANRAQIKAARRRIQIIFQDPYSSLDPRMTVEAIAAEGLRLDPTLSAIEKKTRVTQALEDVGLGGVYARRYVHQLSGGQRQRVAIARALVMRPDIVIADEPVSALDVTVQKQVLDILISLQDSYRFACLLISHDLGVVEQIADRVIVMLRGHVVEEGTRDAVFDAPRHPYTRRLLQAVPELKGNRMDGFRIETRITPALLDNFRYFDPELDGAHLPTLAEIGGDGTGSGAAMPHRTAIDL